MPSVSTQQPNNFDLIRLAAALQVAYAHCAGHFGTLRADRPFSTVVSMFPGVPIFFFISGFLISKSFETNPNWRDYLGNRALRIYPALVVCFALSLPAVWLCGFFNGLEVPRAEFIAWVVAQLTVGQFYNPSFIMHSPTWALNGSVWTISVELQFYLLIPLMYALFGIARASAKRTNLILLCAIAVFLLINQLWTAKLPGKGGAFWPQIPAALFLPWFYMFLVGVLAQRNSAILQRWLAGRFLYVFFIYSAVALLGSREFHWELKDAPEPILFFGLALLTFSAAFSAPTLSERLLRRNDISYGLYLYHMPVVNVLLLTQLLSGRVAVLTALLSSVALGYASWKIVEKPALRLKRHPLYQHGPVTMSG